MTYATSHLESSSAKCNFHAVVIEAAVHKNYLSAPFSNSQ